MVLMKVKRAIGAQDHRENTSDDDARQWCKRTDDLDAYERALKREDDSSDDSEAAASMSDARPREEGNLERPQNSTNPSKDGSSNSTTEVSKQFDGTRPLRYTDMLWARLQSRDDTSVMYL